jgi:RNA polymerase sigma-54 factor
MKHSLQLKLSQHLTLTPQLQQSIRLLQLSTLDLNQEIENFLLENPLLERADAEADGEGTLPPDAVPPMESAPAAPADEPEGEQPAPETSTAEDPWEDSGDWGADGVGQGGSREDGEDSEYPELAAETETLQQHLQQQLRLTQLSDRDKDLVALLIGNLNEDGYLTQPLEEFLAPLPPELEVDIEELQIALKHLQHFDPPGVGARNLAECLVLQLRALPAQTPFRAQALAVVKDHLELLGSRDFNRLKRLLSLDDVQLRGAQKLITGLNPKPGAAFSPVDARYVVPDVVVRKHRGKWSASLNQDAIPKLRVNKLYADILGRSRDANGSGLSSQLQEARWLIKNVQQRFETILKVSQSIVERQKHFFEHGEVAMRPLVLREIAEVVGLHESTVSRVTTQKFMLTPRGIFELKYFFGSHVATDTGGAASSTAIRALIKQLVSAEDTHKPLSDSRISGILGQQGIVVARRTVAKYRESLQISPANLRKSI